MRVLIAEDDASLRTALRLVFADAGHEVFEASSVSGVRDLLFPVIPDALIIDAGLPGDGVALWRELQANTAYRGRAILVTGDPPTLRGLSAEADVFAKPFDYGALLARVRAAGGGATDSVKGRPSGDHGDQRLPSTG
jgi:DNA-binding response OmpR family regulator